MIKKLRKRVMVYPVLPLIAGLVNLIIGFIFEEKNFIHAAVTLFIIGISDINMIVDYEIELKKFLKEEKME